MQTTLALAPAREARDDERPDTRWQPGVTRGGLERLLSPWLAPECAHRLWSDAWELTHITPWSLWAWHQLYGPEVAALAVAAGLDEGQLRRHLKDRRSPDRSVLEMLADLNCFPFVTPAARPMVGV